MTAGQAATVAQPQAGQFGEFSDRLGLNGLAFTINPRIHLSSITMEGIDGEKKWSIQPVQLLTHRHHHQPSGQRAWRRRRRRTG